MKHEASCPLATPSPEKAGADPMEFRDWFETLGWTEWNGELLRWMHEAWKASVAHSTQALRQRVAGLERELDHEKKRHCIGGDLFEAERNRLILNQQTELEYLERAEQAERMVAELREERGSWRRVAEKLESEKQALERMVAELRELVKSLVMFVPSGHPLHARWAALASSKEPQEPKGVALVPEDGFKEAGWTAFRVAEPKKMR